MENRGGKPSTKKKMYVDLYTSRKNHARDVAREGTERTTTRTSRLLVESANGGPQHANA